jgi:hypothetical protein
LGRKIAERDQIRELCLTRHSSTLERDPDLHPTSPHPVLRCVIRVEQGGGRMVMIVAWWEGARSRLLSMRRRRGRD